MFCVILYLHQIPVATNNNSTIDEKKRGPGREEREHFKNLGDWFGPVDKVRIEKLIANIRNGRIPYEEDKRGYIKNYRIVGCEFFFFSKLFAFQALKILIYQKTIQNVKICKTYRININLFKNNI